MAHSVLTIVPKPRMKLDRLRDQATSHSFGLDAIDFNSPLDTTRYFVCPTLTPLYYTSVYKELTDAQALRYNHISGMCFNELSAFFEQSFAGNAVIALAHGGGVSPELAECLEQFVRDETKHCEMWRRLNQLCSPAWYGQTERHIIQVPPAVWKVLQYVTRRPALFPMVIWLMLALEEHSMEVSRRCARADRLEPHFAAVYRFHLEEEVRHVHLDWHLIEQIYLPRSAVWRRINAELFKWVIERFFLRPTSSAVRVIDLLIAEFPELNACRPRIVRELYALNDNIEYQRMMYSRASTPIMFSLFDRLPEFHRISRVLHDYQRPGKSSSVEGMQP
jgi:hypothetical protein